MKRILFIVLSFCFILAISACANLCEQSIDNGSYAIPTWLPGQWAELQPDGKKGSIYTIEAMKDKKGNAVAYDKGADPKSVDFQKHQIVMSLIGNTIFMSIHDNGDEANGVDPGWYLYKFQRVSDKEFSLTPVKEYVIDYSTSQEEIQAYLLANKDKEELYDATATERYAKQ